METSLEANVENVISVEEKLKLHSGYIHESGMKFIELAVRVSAIERLLVRTGVLNQFDIETETQSLMDSILKEIEKQ